MLGHSVSVHGGLGLDLWAQVAVWVGTSGVDVFFVTSGFIVTSVAVRSAERDEARSRRVARFALRRAARIYPIYWLALGCAFLINTRVALAPSWLPHTSVGPLLLLVTQYNYLVPPAWTLAYEIYFYLVLSVLLLVAPRHLFKAIAGWLTLEGVFIYFVWSTKQESLKIHWLIGIMASALVLEFGLGCAIAWLIHAGAARLPRLALGVGVVWFSSGAYIIRTFGEPGALGRTLTFGIGAALVLYGLVSLERAGRFTLPMFLQRLGNASYSLYLWHQMLLVALSALTFATALPQRIPGPLLWLAWVSIIVTWSLVSYHALERPLLGYANRAIDRVLGPSRLAHSDRSG